jgi:hypothetical protein
MHAGEAAEAGELANFLRAQAQVLDVRLELDGEERFVLLIGGRGTRAEVLGRDLGRHRLPMGR